MIAHWVGRRLSQALATRVTRERAAKAAEGQVTVAVWQYLAMKLLRELPLDQRLQLANSLELVVHNVTRAARMDTDAETAAYIAQGARHALTNIQKSIIESQIQIAPGPGAQES